MTSRDNLWTRFKKMWASHSTAVPDFHGPIQAAFTLLHKDEVIGTLTLQDGAWSFTYSEEFKHQHSVRTITEFPDVNKVYRSNELWPFFLMRIPSLRRAKVRDIITQEHIDETDEAELLKRFGRRTVANPFELVSQ
jgi:HipA-like protein